MSELKFNPFITYSGILYPIKNTIGTELKKNIFEQFTNHNLWYTMEVPVICMHSI